ncbi:hypothetical protein F4811DRAFT_515134 [Daldinia bambusicola]|nr:hypothetical protein F4811DRAFT_515134 [Daldinia bambusicola]
MTLPPFPILPLSSLSLSLWLLSSSSSSSCRSDDAFAPVFGRSCVSRSTWRSITARGNPRSFPMEKSGQLPDRDRG